MRVAVFASRWYPSGRGRARFVGHLCLHRAHRETDTVAQRVSRLARREWPWIGPAQRIIIRADGAKRTRYPRVTTPAADGTGTL